MNARTFANEFAKMRHLRVWLLATVLLLAVTGITLYSGIVNPDFDRATDDSWNSLLNTLGGAMLLAAPLLLAIMASRLVDVEHVGGGWLLSATSGVTPGGLCRAKFLALAMLVTGATVAASGIIAGTGFLVGITAPFPAARWTGFTAAVVVVNLVLVAVHIILAARIENQLVGVGIGLLGTVLALFASAFPVWVAHLTPWGYYALASASGYVDAKLVALTPSYPSLGVLAIVTAVAFGSLTGRFDRQEA